MTASLFLDLLTIVLILLFLSIGGISTFLGYRTLSDYFKTQKMLCGCGHHVVYHQPGAAGRTCNKAGCGCFRFTPRHDTFALVEYRTRELELENEREERKRREAAEYPVRVKTDEQLVQWAKKRGKFHG